jgi:hypothetical protein
MIQASEQNKGWALLIALLALLLAISFSIIALHEQNASQLRYKVPFVPIVPTMSIVFNIALMTYLNHLTWLRMTVWMIFGFAVYFGFGITNSRLNPESRRIGNHGVRTWGSVDDDHVQLAEDTTSVNSAY